MSAIIGVLVGAAAKVGATVVKNILQKKIGTNAGDALVDEVVDRVAKKLDVPVNDIPLSNPAKIEAAVAEVETETPEILEQHVRSQELSVDLQKAEMDKATHWWEWAWRPMWMWLLAVLWTWTIFVAPIITALTGKAFAVFTGELATLTVTYTAFYLGGHTAKNIWGKRR